MTSVRTKNEVVVRMSPQEHERVKRLLVVVGNALERMRRPEEAEEILDLATGFIAPKPLASR